MAEERLNLVAAIPAPGGLIQFKLTEALMAKVRAKSAVLIWPRSVSSGGSAHSVSVSVTSSSSAGAPTLPAVLEALQPMKRMYRFLLEALALFVWGFNIGVQGSSGETVGNVLGSHGLQQPVATEWISGRYVIEKDFLEPLTLNFRRSTDASQS